jgi:membrane associated rhomboid family serine protease
LGFQDRPYYREPQPSGHGGFGRPTIAMPRLTPMVKYLLIANVVIFLIQIILRNPEKYSPFTGALEYYFSATTVLKYSAFQVWRLITFQFLHSTFDPFHLLFNMIGLYFLGTVLERSWGSKRFIVFYLICGAVGGLLYVIASSIGIMIAGSLVGASGGVLGLLVACAILFPQMMVILILFPVSIRTAAILLTAVYILIVVTSGRNAGGNLCHLGGMATAFVWIMARPYLSKWKLKQLEGAYQRKLENQQQMQYEVDRILAKVHEQGIQSLTRKEKQILQEATEQQKRE